MFKEIERELDKRGFSLKTRNAIRNSKICIIDDKIEDLRSLIDGLKKEGFSHLIEKNKITSVNEIVESEYDLIILDLIGVANEISKEDGIGILEELKRKEPSLPILVVSGETTEPVLAKKLSLADSIRSKPVKSADLAADVESLLKYRKDDYWGALSILKELRKLHPELRERLNYIDKFKLYILQKSIKKKIIKADSNIGKKLLSVSKIVYDLGTFTLKIVKIVKGLS